MNTTVVARKINERRHRPNPVMTTGEILSTIGSEGMREAIERNWLVPDLETGFMMVNFNAGKLAEVEEACKCSKCGKTDCDCETDSAEKPRSKEMPKAMREAWGAPSVGSSTNRPPAPPFMPTSSPFAPQPPPAPPTPTAQPNKKPQVGSQVAAVEQEGGKEKLYQGTVSGIGQDGRYHLDFGNGERPPMDRQYGPDQLRFVEPTHA
jgi:hypothetical protein